MSIECLSGNETFCPKWIRLWGFQLWSCIWVGGWDFRPGVNFWTNRHRVCQGIPGTNLCFQNSHINTQNIFGLLLNCFCITINCFMMIYYSGPTILYWIIFSSDAESSTSYESYDEPDLDEAYNNVSYDGQLKTDIPLPRYVYTMLLVSLPCQTVSDLCPVIDLGSTEIFLLAGCPLSITLGKF